MLWSKVESKLKEKGISVYRLSKLAGVSHQALSFIMLILVLMSILNKNFSIKINVSPFATVAITGLSFTLALLIATTKNVFEKDELVDIVEYDEKELYKLIGPYIYTALIWLFLGLIITIKLINLLNSVCLLNQILDIVIIFLFIMGLCNLFDLIITNIQDLIKKIERDTNDRNQ